MKLKSLLCLLAGALSLNGPPGVLATAQDATAKDTATNAAVLATNVLGSASNTVATASNVLESAANETSRTQSRLSKRHRARGWEVEVSDHDGLVAHRRKPETVRVGQDYFLKAGQTNSDVVLVFGNARIDGVVEGDLVVVLGSAKLGTNAMVKGDMVVVGGSTTLQTNAMVGGDLVVVGGALDADASAQIGGERQIVEIPFAIPSFGWLKDYVSKGVFLGRPLPHQLGWVWIIVGIFFIIHLLLHILFPKPSTACVTTLSESPFRSLLTGLLTFMLFGPVCLLLAMTGVGLPVIPFLFALLLLAFVFGKLAVYRFAGGQIGRVAGGGMEHPLLALVTGSALFYLLYTIPVLGYLSWGLATLFGLGGAVLAFIGMFKREQTAGRPPGGGAAAMNVNDPSAPPTPGVELVADVTLLPRAGFWIRLAAALLDAIIIMAVSGVLRHIGIFPIAMIAYHIVMWGWKGTTVGGIVTGLKVIRTDGQPLNYGVAAVRSLASIFSLMIMALGFFWAGWDREKQSWHDKIAGTCIVKAPRSVSLI